MAEEKYPDIPLYLQDFIDITYLMQKKVLPRYELLSKWKIDYSRHPKFSGIQKEYNKIVELLVSDEFNFLRFHQKGTKNDRERKAVYFACYAIRQMECFSLPNTCNLMIPNRLDLSMLEGMPEKRLDKARLLLKKLFIINDYGKLIYSPEMVQRNYFSIFRDSRAYVNVLPISEWPEE